MVFHTSNKAVKYPNLKINNTDIKRVFFCCFFTGIINKRKSSTPLASKESGENN